MHLKILIRKAIIRMKIVEIRQQTFPIKSDIRNAVIDFSEMTVSLVALISDQIRDGKRIVGYGFNSNGRYGQSGLLEDRFLPRLRNADPAALLEDSGINFSPERIWQTLMKNEKPGGHGDRAVAVGTLDMAVWDLVSKIDSKPLYQFLAERYGRTDSITKKVWTYAAGGYYYPNKDVASLIREIQSYLDLGYLAVKIKIGGASFDEDLQRIEAVLNMLPSGCRLAVDANGRYSQEEAVEMAEALNSYDLYWFEEPVDPNDFVGHAAVAETYKGNIATGENLLSARDAMNMVLHGGLRSEKDVLQMDPVLSYGIGEYVSMIDFIENNGWSRKSMLPHGGHQLNLAVASGLGIGGCEAYPGVFQPFGGFADGEKVDDGYANVSDDPGLGLERKPELNLLLKEVINGAD